MTNTNITSFRKDIYNMLEQTIKYNEPINISTKNGNAVVLSEEDYNNIMATLEIESNKRLKEKIVEGIKEDLKDCVSESEVEW
ncbi:MAG: type II toxin-antitoxin system Phd/YefM family antitoxin [Clostridia bacterium]|nr:type II toxin-antitoxin system Phd/YefM family antitoxin [Clostridium sp.]